MMNRSELRKSKIAARNSLSQAQREEYSGKIVSKIIESEEFKRAKTILIYRAVKCEVNIDAVLDMIDTKDKKFAFPLCISDSEMIALVPHDQDSWKPGYFGIMEPIPEKSVQVMPEDIDMVICPCTVFDEKCLRMGMGAGFYDRYLEKCTKAYVTAACFEVQKTDSVPAESWDKPMDAVFTEKQTYRR